MDSWHHESKALHDLAMARRSDAHRADLSAARLLADVLRALDCGRQEERALSRREVLLFRAFLRFANCHLLPRGDMERARREMGSTDCDDQRILQACANGGSEEECVQYWAARGEKFACTLFPIE